MFKKHLISKIDYLMVTLYDRTQPVYYGDSHVYICVCVCVVVVFVVNIRSYTAFL